MTKINLKSLALCAAMLSFGFAKNSFDEEGQRLGNINIEENNQKNPRMEEPLRYTIREKFRNNTEMYLINEPAFNFKGNPIYDDVLSFLLIHRYVTLSYNNHKYGLFIKRIPQFDHRHFDHRQFDHKYRICTRLGKKGTSDEYFLIMDDTKKISIFRYNPAEEIVREIDTNIDGFNISEYITFRQNNEEQIDKCNQQINEMKYIIDQIYIQKAAINDFYDKCSWAPNRMHHNPVEDEFGIAADHIEITNVGRYSSILLKYDDLNDTRLNPYTRPVTLRVKYGDSEKRGHCSIDGIEGEISILPCDPNAYYIDFTCHVNGVTHTLQITNGVSKCSLVMWNEKSKPISIDHLRKALKTIGLTVPQILKLAQGLATNFKKIFPLPQEETAFIFE